ncbi:uncharacterized protein LOC143144948 [Ptiloglossa arizonensis]|uniref:uncharacterized protein LOC143144948 n=1 Tax=Ptiloglossa arizonensis TaxID=3350558 RepID=UPI003F9FD7B5
MTGDFESSACTKPRRPGVTETAEKPGASDVGRARRAKKKKVGEKRERRKRFKNIWEFIDDPHRTNEVKTKRSEYGERRTERSTLYPRESGSKCGQGETRVRNGQLRKVVSRGYDESVRPSNVSYHRDPPCLFDRSSICKGTFARNKIRISISFKRKPCEVRTLF